MLKQPTIRRRIDQGAVRLVDRAEWLFPASAREYLHSRIGAPFPAAVRTVGLLFIHVPKNAGNSVQMALYGQLLPSHKPLAAWQKEYPQTMKGTRTAAIVREPVDRFLSAFHYLKNGGQNPFDVQFAARYLHPYDTPGELADAIEKPRVRRWLLHEGYHFRPQVQFLKDTKGEVRIDHLFDYERLDQAAAQLSEVLGKPIQFAHLNQTTHWNPELTDFQRELVRSTYAEDCDLHRQVQT